MTDLLQDLSERVRNPAGDWTKYMVIGSFILYVLGYLVLRFHLTSLGIATDLTIVDERYVFTGARFLVYLVALVPISLMMAFIVWMVWRLLPPTVRKSLSGPIFGIVFAVVMIQLVMRQCFLISNLLLAEDLSLVPPWLAWLLLNDMYMLLYFSAIVAACVVPIAILITMRNDEVPLLTRGLLIFLAGVQVLLVPVNYGVLVVDKALPRVAALGDRPLAESQEAWVAWEGQKGVTFLVRNRATRQRELLTLNGEMKQMEVIGFDPIFPTLFGSPTRGPQ